VYPFEFKNLSFKGKCKYCKTEVKFHLIGLQESNIYFPDNNNKIELSSNLVCKECREIEEFKKINNCFNCRSFGRNYSESPFCAILKNGVPGYFEYNFDNIMFPIKDANDYLTKSEIKSINKGICPHYLPMDSNIKQKNINKKSNIIKVLINITNKLFKEESNNEEKS